MPFLITQYLIKFPFLRELLLSRLRKRFSNHQPTGVSSEYVLRLMEFIDAEKVNAIYKPLRHGNRSITVHCKSAVEFLDRCVTLTDTIDKNGSIQPIKRLPKVSSIDDWLTDEDDVPVRMDYVVETILPEIRRLCIMLDKHKKHESIGYFQRQSSKVLQDAKCLIEALLNITN